MAGAYAVYHGAEGLTAIAARVHRSAQALATWLRTGGVDVVHGRFFDTVQARVPGRAAEVVAAAAQRRVHLRPVGADTVRGARGREDAPAPLPLVSEGV